MKSWAGKYLWDATGEGNEITRESRGRNLGRGGGQPASHLISHNANLISVDGEICAGTQKKVGPRLREFASCDQRNSGGDSHAKGEPMVYGSMGERIFI